VQAAEALAEAEQVRASTETSWQEAVLRQGKLQVRLMAKLSEEGFADSEAVKAALLPLERCCGVMYLLSFLAQEQMGLVAWQASERLKKITQNQYALEMSSDGGFLIRDDTNGGVRRPVSTLSGRETFQASLALGAGAD